MNNFEPTLLGITVFVISISELNEYFQFILIIATIVYTIIKIVQLLRPKK
tara:strand:- start:522 stop:671 length:150 start_codon:yes stop_codon:yes gene_type:complete